ncbi:NAD(P)-dependent oxidoreductase [Flavobacterium silvaticum]|uniref:NAD(P)H-binding protein n=1 Tax=Flavobacterium silvaticum TaxID=1852020 RepID=A0A972FUN5_9FLAO|nr:NAD(P)H-binding protein [Flavobacterium silvaticum]NMH29644.1 NAD(P)H-binding protein [Flavobacterium silvaticum]
MKKHTIAVIGGTGKAGKYLVKELLKQGFQLKLLIRNPEQYNNNGESVKVIVGNANDYSAVKKLIEGCHAVISTLGLGQPNSEKSIFSVSTGNVIKAMNELEVNRYIVITGLNVDTPFDKKSQKTQSGTDWMKKNYPETTLDKQKEFEVLSQSSVDWTLVRLPLIALTDQVTEIDASLEDCLGDSISAFNLALFLIRQLSDENYLRKAPFIWNR